MGTARLGIVRSPEVAEAIPELVRRGWIAPERAAPRLRAARGDLVSARGELRALLYLSVLLLVAGVSLLVKENLERIGPLGIASGLGLAALACLAWTLRRSPEFSWQRAVSADWSFDYLLLLGILLAGLELAYVEAKFTPLGEHWRHHLLLLTGLTAGLALRCDSRLAWSLALSTFAAWRGLATARLIGDLMQERGDLRWNLLTVGAVFVGLGLALRRFDRKAHFEPLTTWLGAALVLVGLGLGSFADGGWGRLWSLALLGAAVATALVALRYRRFAHFALGALGAYAAASRLMVELLHDPLGGCFWFAASSVAMILLLVFVQRRFRAESE